MTQRHPKVDSVLRVLRNGGWRDEEIEIEESDVAGHTLYHIHAERHAGTLAHSWISTGVYGKGRGRLTRGYYDSFGFHRQYRPGWAGIRSLASWGFTTEGSDQ